MTQTLLAPAQEAAGGYATRAAAASNFFEYVETYYNRVRLRSTLDYPSPVDFEDQINQI